MLDGQLHLLASTELVRFCLAFKEVFQFKLMTQSITKEHRDLKKAIDLQEPLWFVVHVMYMYGYHTSAHEIRLQLMIIL